MSRCRPSGWSPLRAVALGVALLAVVGSISACGGGGNATAGSEGASTAPPSSAGGGGGTESLQGKKVALVTCEPNVFCHAYNENIKKLLGEKGIEVTQLSDNFEPELQNQHMEQAIASNPDLIMVLASNSDAIVPALARAKAASVPVMNLHAELEPEGEEYVTFESVADHKALGRMAAENLVEGMKKAGYKEGRIIVITGTAGTLIVKQRMEEFDKYMEKYPQYEVVTPVDSNWEPTEASKEAVQLLTKYRDQGGVQGAYGMADYLATAIIQGANQLGIKSGSSPGDLVVTGGNCTPAGIPPMEQGVLWGNATDSPIVESEAIAKLVGEYLEGKQVPKTTTTHEERFTDENYKKFIPLCAEWP